MIHVFFCFENTNFLALATFHCRSIHVVTRPMLDSEWRPVSDSSGSSSSDDDGRPPRGSDGATALGCEEHKEASRDRPMAVCELSDSASHMEMYEEETYSEESDLELDFQVDNVDGHVLVPVGPEDQDGRYNDLYLSPSPRRNLRTYMSPPSPPPMDLLQTPPPPHCPAGSFRTPSHPPPSVDSGHFLLPLSPYSASANSSIPPPPPSEIPAPPPLPTECVVSEPELLSRDASTGCDSLEPPFPLSANRSPNSNALIQAQPTAAPRSPPVACTTFEPSPLSRAALTACRALDFEPLPSSPHSEYHPPPSASASPPMAPPPPTDPPAHSPPPRPTEAYSSEL